MNIKLLNYIGLDLLYNPWYGVHMGLSCSFLRKIKKTSKNPSKLPSLTVFCMRWPCVKWYLWVCIVKICLVWACTVYLQICAHYVDQDISLHIKGTVSQKITWGQKWYQWIGHPLSFTRNTDSHRFLFDCHLSQKIAQCHIELKICIYLFVRPYAS